MWRNTYKDYRPDGEWVHEWVEPGQGIIGCEMHERDGWGLSQQFPKERKRGWIRTLTYLLTTRKRKK